MIPQANPGANYQAHRQEIEAAVARVLADGRYILGPETEAFEREFAAYIGVKFAIGVGSGTEALHLALRAAAVGAGDEVVTASHTAVATVAAIEMAGARPIFVDIQEDSYTLDAKQLAPIIGPRTRAIIPVHLYGQAADLQPILAAAKDFGLVVIEDCAQAHGATYEGKRVGSIGLMGCFSFYPTKNLGGIGDAGAIVTDDESVASRLRLLRQYGWRDRYISSVPGWNSRLDEIQAGILRVKLQYLEKENAVRRKLASAYREMLNGCKVMCPVEMRYGDHVYHLYVVRTARRDELKAWLASRGIGTSIHYPLPVHLQPAYVHLGYPMGSLPKTEMAADRILSLPLYPELGIDQIQQVGMAIREFEGR